MRTRLAQAFAGQPARQGGRSNDKSGDRTQVQMWREGTARTGQGQDKVQCKTGSNRIKYRVVQDSKRTVGDNRGRDTGSTLLQQYNKEIILTGALGTFKLKTEMNAECESGMPYSHSMDCRNGEHGQDHEPHGY